MNFGEVIKELKKGCVYTRHATVSWYGKFIVMQIPQTIPADIVPKMTSLPDQVKGILGAMGDGSISYHDQVLIVEANDNCKKSHATYYIPTWEDLFAEDWIAIP
jgi:hypothetical protein